MSRDQAEPSGDSEGPTQRGTSQPRTECGADQVSAAGPLLDRTAIEAAFRRLGDALARRGVVADLYVFDGAAMALAYDTRRVTRDIDAIFTPHCVVIEEANAVAAELGLPRWWLNEQANVYVAPGGDTTARRIFDHPGLRVSAASPEHLHGCYRARCR